MTLDDGIDPRCDKCTWWRDKDAEILNPDGKGYTRLGACHVDNREKTTRADWWCRDHSSLAQRAPIAHDTTQMDAYLEKWRDHPDKPRPLDPNWCGPCEKLPPLDQHISSDDEWAGDEELDEQFSGPKHAQPMHPLLNPDPTHTEPPKDTAGDGMGDP